jgi:hypothetical protein
MTGPIPSGPQYTVPGAVNRALNWSSWALSRAKRVDRATVWSLRTMYVTDDQVERRSLSCLKEPTLERAGPPQTRSTRISGW